MSSWAWHCVVGMGAVSVLFKTGWPMAGTTRAEVRCGAARRPSGEHSQFRSFDDGRHPDRGEHGRMACARGHRPGDKAVTHRTVIPHNDTEVDSYPAIWLLRQVSTRAEMSHLFRTFRYPSGGHCRRSVTTWHAARSQLTRPRE